ncbi:MAG: response regulator [Proteobacteria bacterium]|nr:response regulator [Pseudomonadota bacterium]
MPIAAQIKTVIVDDQSTMRSLLRACLRQIGVSQVTECCDGEEALEVLKRVPTHLVISDLNMPKLDGIGLLRAVRGDPAIAKTAFIMLTSHAERNCVQDAVKFGVNNYLVKPFNFAGLKTKIEAVFGPLT